LQAGFSVFCGSLFASVPAARVVTATAGVGQGRACVCRSTRLHTVRTCTFLMAAEKKGLIKVCWGFFVCFPEQKFH